MTAFAASAARTLGPWAWKAVQAAGALMIANSLWDEGKGIGAPDWTKAGKRRLAGQLQDRFAGDDAAMDAGAEIPEDRMAARLSDLAGLAHTPRTPSTFLEARDQQFMREIEARYRRQLQEASMEGGPSLAELAAKTGLLS